MTSGESGLWEPGECGYFCPERKSRKHSFISPNLASMLLRGRPVCFPHVTTRWRQHARNREPGLLQQLERRKRRFCKREAEAENSFESMRGRSR